jgi:hypothetical protein
LSKIKWYQEKPKFSNKIPINSIHKFGNPYSWFYFHNKRQWIFNEKCVHNIFEYPIKIPAVFDTLNVTFSIKRWMKFIQTFNKKLDKIKDPFEQFYPKNLFMKTFFIERVEKNNNVFILMNMKQLKHIWKQFDYPVKYSIDSRP